MHARRRNESDTYRRAHAHILFYKFVIQLFNGKRTRTDIIWKWRAQNRSEKKWKNYDTPFHPGMH